MTEPDRAWRGTAAELAEHASHRLARIGLTEQRLTERQVRFYVAEGVLSRPERAGREALFAYRQLLELLVARLLSRDGWPLAKIAAWIRTADERALTDLIPERRDPPGVDDGWRESGPDAVAERLRERLRAAQQAPPHRAERFLRLQVPGAFELLLPETEARAMTPDKAERIARMVRDLLLSLDD